MREARARRHAVILCHPDHDSFDSALASRYLDAAREVGHEAMLRDLYRLDLAHVPKSSEQRQNGDDALAPEVTAEIEAIRGADVFVLVYSLWFGTPPRC